MIDEVSTGWIFVRQVIMNMIPLVWYIGAFMRQYIYWSRKQKKKGCFDEVYPDREVVLRMAEAETDGRVPERLLPKCPKCGGSMVVSVK